MRIKMLTQNKKMRDKMRRKLEEVNYKGQIHSTELMQKRNVIRRGFVTAM